MTVVQQASKFASEVRIYKKENPSKKYDAKSILSVLALGAGKDARIVIEVKGPDEDEAIEKLSSLIESLKE